MKSNTRFGRILAGTLAAFLLILGVAWNTQPANAAPLKPWRFQYSSVCVNNYLPNSAWPVNASRLEWNKAPDLNVYYGWMIPTWPYYQGCAETYPEAQRIDVHYYNDEATSCGNFIIHYNGYGHVTDADVWLNVKAACQNTATERGHYTSKGIGYALGLALHTETYYSVMSESSYARDNIAWPQPFDFTGIEQRYPW